jgi:hypothetical protein
LAITEFDVMPMLRMMSSDETIIIEKMIDDRDIVIIRSTDLASALSTALNFLDTHSG